MAGLPWMVRYSVELQPKLQPQNAGFPRAGAGKILPPSGIERQAKDLIRIDQRFGDVTRTGPWVVPRRMEIKLAAGDVKLDFTRALITQDSLRMM